VLIPLYALRGRRQMRWAQFEVGFSRARWPPTGAELRTAANWAGLVNAVFGLVVAGVPRVFFRKQRRAHHPPSARRRAAQASRSPCSMRRRAGSARSRTARDQVALTWLHFHRVGFHRPLPFVRLSRCWRVGREVEEAAATSAPAADFHPLSRHRPCSTTASPRLRRGDMACTSSATCPAAPRWRRC
jgi:hypothetical protein